MNKRHVLKALPILLLGPAAFLPITEDASGSKPAARGPEWDLSAHSPAPPPRPVPMLFIHHSCGGQMLAPAGAEEGDRCIYVRHPNGGDLRAKLEAQGYVVHEASYGSVVGEATDLFDWLPKFKGKMDRVLSVARQDEALPPGQTNRIVVFKSCFPNSAFTSEGAPPGDPSGPELTVWNARATLAAVLGELKKHPEVLFVYVTAPPVAPKRRERAYKWLGRKVGLMPRLVPLEESARLARAFNDWVKSPEGWLSGYPEKNVAVFDYFDALTGNGQSNALVYPTGGGLDSHPSREGNARAADAFVPFLNRASRRAGLFP